jgi:redox-sensing transcriptional repressor
VKSKNKHLSHALLERLMHYYYFVGEQILAGGGRDTVTSTEIAQLIHMDDTLVRKDLASIGVRGYPRVGFKATEVLEAIRRVLGFDRTYRAVVIGAGRLGSAMASYRGFTKYGLEICSIFDKDPAKVGVRMGHLVIQPLEDLAIVVEGKKVQIAILTVPPEVAQKVVDFAVSSGIQAIWNFASTSLKAPEHVFIRHEHISIGLAELSYHLKSEQREDRQQA